MVSAVKPRNVTKNIVPSLFWKLSFAPWWRNSYNAQRFPLFFWFCSKCFDVSKPSEYGGLKSQGINNLPLHCRVPKGIFKHFCCCWNYLDTLSLGGKWNIQCFCLKFWHWFCAYKRACLTSTPAVLMWVVQRIMCICSWGKGTEARRMWH